jgi:hypothetical protein
MTGNVYVLHICGHKKKVDGAFYIHLPQMIEAAARIKCWDCVGKGEDDKRDRTEDKETVIA